MEFRELPLTPFEQELVDTRERLLRQVEHALGVCDCEQPVLMYDRSAPGPDPVSYRDVDGRFYIVDELGAVPEHLFALDLVLVDGVWQLPRC